MFLGMHLLDLVQLLILPEAEIFKKRILSKMESHVFIMDRYIRISEFTLTKH